MGFLKLILFFIIIEKTTAEVFSSIEELESLSYNQEKLIHAVNWLILKLEETVAQLQSDVKAIESEHKLMQEDSFAYILNPLNALLLIKRLSLDLIQTVDQINGIAEQHAAHTNLIRLPRVDFEGAVEGLARLQIMYGLKTEDLAKGIIEDKKYRDDLTSKDLFSIGVELMNSRSFLLSLSYLNLALDVNSETNSMSEITILEGIYRNHNQTGNIEEAVKTVEKILKLAPDREDLQLEVMKLELASLFNEDPERTEPVAKPRNIKESLIQIDACSGKFKRSDADISKLRCRFVSKTAFSKICPFKVEEVNLNPYIAIFHEVISEGEIQAFKSMSKPNLYRAMVLNKDSTNRVDSIRVAKHSWHRDIGHKIFERLTQRVVDMTGLNRKSFEDWQTQNYGIGGHYAAHFDFTMKDAEPFNTGNGNRMATVLLYLSDVEKGGATIFPYLGIKLLPIKGAAVFWYNLSTSGELEYLTRHAGCPVLIGSKWVANKWIHEQGQEWTRPCELQPAETNEFYYRELFSKYS